MARVKKQFPRFTLSFGNFTWQRTKDEVLARFLARLGVKKVWKRPSAVAGVEMHDFSGRTPVAFRGFLGRRYQYAQDLSNGQDAGSGFALRKNSGWKIINWDKYKGSDPGPGVGPRYILRVRIEHKKSGAKRTILVVHFPLGKTGRQEQFRNNLKEVVAREKSNGTVGAIVGDVNSDHRQLREFLNVPHSWGIQGEVNTIMTWGDWGPVEVTFDEDVPWATDHATLTLHAGEAASSSLVTRFNKARENWGWSKKRRNRRKKR